MGYGYGVWLIPNEMNGYGITQVYNTKPHIRHVTLACNMTYEDANNLLFELHYRKLIPKNGWVIPLIRKFESSYKEDCVFAAGWTVFIYNWFKYESIVGDRGQVPEKPHMSLLYSKNPIHDLTIEYLRRQDNDPDRRLTFFPAVVDIRSDNPNEWYVKTVLA